MRFVVFGILDMRWKYRKMVKPQERLFMQSKRLHKESFLWNDLFHDKNKSEPIANRRKVRIYSLWEALTKKIPGENENFMHVGDSHHKLTIWYHIIGTKYIAQIRFELCVDLNSN